MPVRRDISGTPASKMRNPGFWGGFFLVDRNISRRTGTLGCQVRREKVAHDSDHQLFTVTRRHISDFVTRIWGKYNIDIVNFEGKM